MFPSHTSINYARPFIAGPKVTNPALFVGRKDALHTITEYMTGPQPTSVNVVGKRRIGKSSLLYHFSQTWEQRVSQVNRYVVVCLSLQGARCKSKGEFYHEVAQALLQSPRVRSGRGLTTDLRKRNIDASGFADALIHWKRAEVLPVVCLDDFEVWLNNRDEFDDDFFDHLRFLTNNNMLMLIIASLRPLYVYRTEQRLTSPFFNDGRLLVLEEFTDEEVMDLLKLPASTRPEMQAALCQEDQQRARNWGGKHPYLLQLAASELLQARQQGKRVGWAKAQFDREKKLLSRSRPQRRPNRWHWLNPFSWISNVAFRIGEAIDGVKKVIIGIAVVICVVVVPIALIIGRITPAQIWELFSKVMGW